MLRFASVLLFTAGILPVWGAEGERFLDLTLGKAIRMALEKNFSIEAQRLDPKAAAERERTAKGTFDPSFGLSYSQRESVQQTLITQDVTGAGSRSLLGLVNQSSSWSANVTGVTVWGLGYDFGLASFNLGGNSNRSSDNYTSEASFSIRQPLLRGAGTAANLAGVRIARNNVTISEWSVKQQIMSVITQVIEVYNELQFTQENLEVALRSRGRARQLLRDNIKRVEIGVKTPLDVTTAQAEAAAREQGVITTMRAVKDTENFLKQLITADLIPLLRLQLRIAPPPSPGFAADVLAAITDALEFRPDYRQAKIDIESRNITTAFAKNAKLPRLDLVASLNLLGMDADFLNSIARTANQNQRSWIAGATFSFPLGNRTARGQYNSAKLDAAQALVRLQQLEQDIIVKVDNASGAVVTTRALVAATAEARRLATESLNAGEARLIAGTGTTFEVLELQEKLGEAETSELRARADYNKAVARFHLQTGTTLRVHGVDVK